MGKNPSWLSHPSRLLGKTQVKTQVATKMALEYELPTLLLNSELYFSFWNGSGEVGS